jgi:5'-nucleotidase
MIYKNVSRLIAILLICASTACNTSGVQNLTILHTNDTHSQIEPLEAGKRDANCGGYARRIGYINQQREADPDLLLFDAGDFSQGTRYFNFYRGRIEIDALNRMGYDAITLGNHEFDNGLDTLAAALKGAQFPIVCANYDVTNSPLEGIVKPYTIIRRKNIRIGVFGIGVDPKGLVAERNFSPIKYLDPIESAQQVATLLKHQKHCDLVICLSHQGTNWGDVDLVKNTKDIDIIIGGHTHKIVTNHYLQNIENDSVFLAQMGKAGARIGKIKVEIAE